MHHTVPAEENVKILWTGGWDSTFVLLRTLLEEKRGAIPYYLIDADRRSTGAELRTMKKIKEELFRLHPACRSRVAPTRFAAVSDLEANQCITEAYRVVCGKNYLGSQYEWLARYCNQYGIHDMQLCIHRDDKAHDAIVRMVSPAGDSARSWRRIDRRFETTAEYALLGSFVFPAFTLSKPEMAATAARRGWSALMNMTWFCHNPTSLMQPCGRCNPCLYTIEEGLGWRIPPINRMMAIAYGRPLQAIKMAAKTALYRAGNGRPALSAAGDPR
jgi:7-cyano-7-deazaguanine synthase in queuosine biosynthesis